MTAEVAAVIEGGSHSAGLPVRRIVLTGFMGAGKSTVGALLAMRLGWTFADVDCVIEAAEGMSVAAIFAGRGETAFRRLEHETIGRLLATDRVVIALGGGAIEDPETRRMTLESDGTRLVHLEVSMATVLERCRGTEDIRPVLRDREHLDARYSRRLPLYREAHLNVAVDALLPEAVAAAVLEQIGIQR